MAFRTTAFPVPGDFPSKNNQIPNSIGYNTNVRGSFPTSDIPGTKSGVIHENYWLSAIRRRYVLCDYPKFESSVTNNRTDYWASLINNELLPVHGDLVWEIADDSKRKTDYTYQGETQLALNLILQYEAYIFYNTLNNALIGDRKTNTTALLQAAVGGALVITTAKDYIERSDEIGEALKNPNVVRNLDQYRVAIDFYKTYFEDDPFHLCLDLEAMARRFNYIGVCQHRKDNTSDHSDIFRDVSVQYLNEVDTYIVSPRNGSEESISEYWYQTSPIEPVQLYIASTNERIDSIEALITDLCDNRKVKDINNEDIRGTKVKVQRGRTLGKVKDKSCDYSLNKEHFYDIQRFPYGHVKYRKVKYSRTHDLIHRDKLMKKKLFRINVN